MAKIHQEVILIKLNKLVRDNEETATIAGPDVVESLQAVAQELAGAGIIVEVELVE
jgi:hypothetical protein